MAKQKAQTEINNKGITLIALIITIIVMLILTGVTINAAINGGLFNIAKDVSNNIQKEIENELRYPNETIDKWINGAEDTPGDVPGDIPDEEEQEQKIEEETKEVEDILEDIKDPEVEDIDLDEMKEELEKKLPEGYEVEDYTNPDLENEEKALIVRTPSGGTTIITKQEVYNYMGADGMTIRYTPSEWTNNVPVKVSVTKKVAKYTLLYSMDGKRWYEYTNPLEIYQNGTKIYFELAYLNMRGPTVTVSVDNIDRLAPISIEITDIEKTANSITVTANAQDAIAVTEGEQKDGNSGIAKYYFSKDGGNTWEPKNGQAEGTYTFEKLTQKTEYSIKVKAEDRAKNGIELETALEVSTDPMPAEAAIEFTYDPSTWTNGKVKVGISTEETNYTLQYSSNGTTWANYTREIEMTDNGQIYARLTDGTNVGEVATGNVMNIDKVAPVIETDVSGILSDKEEGSVTLSVGVKDEESGIKKIEWYYKKATEAEYTIETDIYVQQTKNDEEEIIKGEITSIIKTHELKGLDIGKYNMYAIVYDLAENSTRSPEGTETIEITVTSVKAAINALTVKTAPEIYYGEEVNYAEPCDGVEKWRIFYSSGTNIYLIADDYISYQYAPTGQGGTAINYYYTKTDSYPYRLYCTDIVTNKDYTGTADITDTTIQALNSDYFSQYTSTNTNAQVTAYLLDTNRWNEKYRDTTCADYAIGTPTLELWCNSYKDTHSSKYVICKAFSVIGYGASWNSSTLTKNSVSLTGLVKDDYNKIYMNSDKTNAEGVLLASPSVNQIAHIWYVGYSANMGFRGAGNNNCGLRPVVCLNSEVKLVEQNGIYVIQ